MTDTVVTCLLLASVTGSVSAVSFPAIISSQCSLSEPLQNEQLMSALNQFQQQLGPPGCMQST